MNSEYFLEISSKIFLEDINFAEAGLTDSCLQNWPGEMEEYWKV